jgi:hypothetical protein
MTGAGECGCTACRRKGGRGRAPRHCSRGAPAAAPGSGVRHDAPSPPAPAPPPQDRERGVVWEETIIFLDHATKMVGAARKGGPVSGRVS